MAKKIENGAQLVRELAKSGTGESKLAFLRDVIRYEMKGGGECPDSETLIKAMENDGQSEQWAGTIEKMKRLAKFGDLAAPSDLLQTNIEDDLLGDDPDPIVRPELIPVAGALRKRDPHNAAGPLPADGMVFMTEDADGNPIPQEDLDERVRQMTPPAVRKERQQTRKDEADGSLQAGQQILEGSQTPNTFTPEQSDTLGGANAPDGSGLKL